MCCASELLTIIVIVAIVVVKAVDRESCLRFLGKGAVRVVFRPFVQSKVQPGNTHATGREPNRFCCAATRTFLLAFLEIGQNLIVLATISVLADTVTLLVVTVFVVRYY
jgi:hypothetical protein